MTARATRQQDRSVTNPVFSSRKLKLGTFQTNLDSGCVMSDLEGRLDISWPNTLGLAMLAEEMDFEALVPVARWHGFGRATNPQGRGFEAYTWAAGIAASTAKASVFATSHISLNHPIVAAKQSTVIDHISGGRYALNIVTGWNKPEIDMFGSPMLGHEDRYACAEEWITVIKRLWTEDDAFDHEGRFYKIKQGYLQPKPIQAPYPAIMNAGATEKEARDFYRYYVHEKGDWQAAQNMIDIFSLEINARTIPPERLKAFQEAFLAGWGGFPLIGTKEQIVDGLQALSRAGLDGVLLAWPRFEQGMREFRDVTYPLVRQAGLREFG